MARSLILSICTLALAASVSAPSAAPVVRRRSHQSTNDGNSN
jgi:hypothetical protein